VKNLNKFFYFTITLDIMENGLKLPEKKEVE